MSSDYSVEMFKVLELWVNRGRSRTVMGKDEGGRVFFLPTGCCHKSMCRMVPRVRDRNV